MDVLPHMPRFDLYGDAPRRRDLRRRMTPAEKRLWEVLRNPTTLGFRVRRQYAIGTSVIDFFIPSAGLGIELDIDVLRANPYVSVEMNQYDPARRLMARGRG